MSFRKSRNQSGQAVLIVLLSLSVVLIIVLYIMSRSVTDISLTTKEEDSMRAFSAAEAGIERALVIGSGVDSGVTSIGDAKFTVKTSDFGKGLASVVYPYGLKSGEVATFWLTRPSETPFAGSMITVCWGAAGTSETNVQTPALEISIFYKTPTGETRVYRKMLDPYSGRTSNNGYSTGSGTCTVGTENFQFKNTTNVSALTSMQFITAKFLYNNTVSHKVGITVTGGLLPSQGTKISSDGSYGDSNRSIEVFQLHPVVPPIFMNAIYSANGIVK